MTAQDPDPLRGCGNALLAHIGPAALHRFATALAQGRARDAVLASITLPDAASAARTLAEMAEPDPASRRAVSLYLAGLAEGASHVRSQSRPPELVWSGPGTVRGAPLTTGTELANLIAGAQHELLLTTYSASPHPPLIAALTAAAGRAVRITIVVDTHAGARGALSGREPAAAFLVVPGAELWHWPPANRPIPNARLHAKLAVADRSVMLVGSANLTGSGIDDNLETGVLIAGGPLPARAVEHILRLQRNGALVPVTAR